MPATAAAMIDRLVHHAEVVVTDGESFRLAQATADKGGDHLAELTQREISCPAGGESSCPPAGRSRDRHWGDPHDR
jgi:IstB-like ATP binding protein